MSNHNRHKAAFLVSRFLNSKISLSYRLKATHRSILRYIADCIDFNHKQNGYNNCLLSYDQIGLYSGMSKSSVERAMPYLIKNKILHVKEKIGCSYIYWLGDLSTTDVNLKATPVNVDNYPRQNDGTSNNTIISNNKNNKLYTDVENQSTSYKPCDIKRSDKIPDNINWEEIRKKLNAPKTKEITRTSRY